MLYEDYTITELEEHTGLSRRTIHFYIQQGLIRPPAGAGGAARYTEEHLLRLKLIPVLQQSHLKLSGIKEALDAMDLAQMRRLLRDARPTVDVRDPANLKRWVTSRPPAAAQTEPLPEAEERDSLQFSFAALDKPKEPDDSRRDRVLTPESAVSRPSSSLHWQRLELTDGVELHLREDQIVRFRSLVAEIVRLFTRYQK